MKKKNLMFLLIILVVSCFFLTSCLTTLVCKTIIWHAEAQDENDPIPMSLEEINTELTNNETFELFDSYELLANKSNKSKNARLDTLGFDISIEDAEIYALASEVAGEPLNAYKMLSYLGCSVSDEKMEKAENYLKGIELLKKGHPYEALKYFSVCTDILNSEKICDAIMATLQVGGVGPSGGIIFYDKGYYSDGWRYLEAAPEDLEKKYVFGCYRTSDDGSGQMVGTSTAIGTGKSNTETLVKTMGEATYQYYDRSKKGTYAAKACADYSITVDGIVYDDWFLPSEDELNLMYEKLSKKGMGSFTSYYSLLSYDYYYWSSSEASTYYAATQTFSDGHQSTSIKDNEWGVRPIRAF